MDVVTKTCPVVLRQTDTGWEILVFRHPLAGVQLVKGTIEPGEAPEAAALRELAEESGIANGRVTAILGLSATIVRNQIWHFPLIETGALDETWTFHADDGGGNDFVFFWHKLASPPTDEWHPVFVAALAYVGGAFAAHCNGIAIRDARPEDAAACADVVRRSIVELCTADHRDDPEVIAGWTANKTPDFVRELMAHPDILVIVAERDGVIVGVGAGNGAGEITLNYVAPEARFTGVSSGLLNGLEAMILEAGHNTAGLTSTRTAHAFYSRRGYLDDGEPVEWRGALAFPMRKVL